jgi:HEPN domain-containing protein
MSDQAPELVQDWLQRAHSSLKLGRAGLRTTGVMPEDVCFHAQQCAEKALKGLLTSLTIQHPRTHALEVLLDLLKANDIQVPANVDEAFELTHTLFRPVIPVNGNLSPRLKPGTLWSVRLLCLHGLKAISR